MPLCTISLWQRLAAISELCRAKENLAPDRNKVTRAQGDFFRVVYELQTEGPEEFYMGQSSQPVASRIAAKSRVPQVTYWIFNVATLARISLDAHTSRPMKPNWTDRRLQWEPVFVAGKANRRLYHRN